MSARNELALASGPRDPALRTGASISLLIRGRGVALTLATDAVPQAMAAEVAPAPAPVKINPTKRILRFIVPVTDGPTYLGDIDLAVAPDDSLSVAKPRLMQMLEPILKPDVLARLKAAIGASDSVTAQQLAAEMILLSYDSQKLALSLAIPVTARRTSAMSLRAANDAGGETLQPASASGYINLRSAIDVIERGPQRGLMPPVSLIDGAARLFGVVAEGEGYLSLREGEPLLRRTGTRLVYDDIDRTMRWALGDVRPFGTSFQSTPTMGGLSVSRIYSILQPQREVRSTGSQSFSLFAPSTVETIVNGRTVERKLLQPGNYTLQDFPLAEGANDVRLQIEDETGKRRLVEFNLYSNRSLLDPGLTEFSAFAGVYARPTRAGVAYSNDWSASGFVRRGLNRRLTTGLNFQADRNAQQVGLELLGGSGIGLIGAEVAVSQRDGRTGYAASASFEKLIQEGSGEGSQSLRGLVEVRSADFAIPGVLLVREPMAMRVSAGYSMTFGRDAFLTLDGQYSKDRVQKEHRYSLRASGGIGIAEGLSLVSDIQFERGRSGHSALIRFGLRKRFGGRSYGQVDADSRGVVKSTFQSSGGRGIGAWSGSLDLTRDTSGASFNGNGTYTANRAELGVSQIATYDTGGGSIRDMRTSLRVGTSLAFADGALALGRPIQDSFLIASTHSSLRGKPVRLDPQDRSENARSGLLGAALEGGLSAHSPRLLIYDVPEAPAGYDLGAGNVGLLPPYRAGYKLTVGSDYHLLVIGRLLGSDGDPISLLAGKAIDLGAPKRPATTIFTSRAGKFGAQGLRPGRWRIEMPTEPPTIYEIQIQDDPTGTVRVGDLRPVTARKGER
jgi:outer membrane usher protein